MKIELPEKVKFILDTLNENNYSAYIVGGCVRDSLMGKEPKDWDITTNATPDEVENIFGNSAEYQQLMKVTNANYKPPFKDVCTIATGKQYGTITVKMTDRELMCVGVPGMMPFEKKTDNLFEITTFRKDGNYSDGRRPDKVEFGNNLDEDLERRDFTINAMAYSTLGGLYDPFNGLNDLSSGKIRCVGIATERFNEDALRILRALRFALRFNFVIEEDTRLAVVDKFKSNHLNNVSKERIYSEFKQILSYDRFLHTDIGILINSLLKYMFGTNYVNKLDSISDFKFLEKMVCLFIKNNLSETEILLRENKFSNDEIKFILTYINLFSKRNKFELINEISVKEDLRVLDIGLDLDNRIDSFRKIANSLYTENISNIWYEKVKIVLKNKEPYKLSQLAVNGDDLIKRGIKGKDIGQTLERLLQVVIEDSSLNLKHILLNML